MRALLIIDMQLGSFRPYEVRYDALGTVERINRLSEAFRAKFDKVIFIQHDGSKEGAFVPGTDDWKLLPELVVETGDIMVSKTANDSFYKTELHDLLTRHGIDELFITGCATDFCVDSTIKSALTKDYRVTVVADGHTTADRPYVAARTVIDHYNWLWADMTPTAHKIAVVPTEDILVG